MGRRSPRNSSSLVSPREVNVAVAAFSVISNAIIDAVPNCSSKDWGIVNKDDSSPECSEGLWVTVDMADDVPMGK